MNKQATKEIRNGEAALYNCEGVDKLREALTAIWPNDLSNKSSQGRFSFYLILGSNSWKPEHENPLPKSYTPSEVLREQQELTEQELLEEAKRRYPVGTKFVDFEGIKYEASCDPWLLFRKKIVVREAGEGGVCYHEGKWAEIIEQPKKKEYIVETAMIINRLESAKKDIDNLINKIKSEC